MNTIAYEIRKKIDQCSKIVLLSHTNPDGDAIGSALALYHFLISLKKEAQVIVPNPFPGFLLWMDGANKICIASESPQQAEKALLEADAIICVDFNGYNRTAQLGGVLQQTKAIKILIDHHLQPEPGFDLVYSIIEISSTSELLYQLFDIWNEKHLITQPVAEALFVGIMTDTGSFSYSCNYPQTFYVVGDLISRGINLAEIHNKVYDTYSENRMRLLGYCLNEKLKVFPEFSTAYISLSKKEMEEFGYETGDTEGVVNYALSIKGINFAALFTERDDYVRISFRSKGRFSVNAFARNHFEGGGHKNAAGANSYANLFDTLLHFEQLLPQYAEEIRLSNSIENES